MSVAVRVIPCLDVDDGRVVKGVNFENLRDAGDPVELARRYGEQGADELTFLDVTASSGDRATMYDVVARTAEEVFIPLTVGGGVRTVDDVDRLLRAGADKVGVNTAADRPPRADRRDGRPVRRPGARALGRRPPPARRVGGPRGWLRGDDARRSHAHRHRRRRLVRPRGRARRRRDPAQLDGRRRHQGRLRPRAHPPRPCGGDRAGHRLRGRRRGRPLRACGAGGGGCRARRQRVPLRRADHRARSRTRCAPTGSRCADEAAQVARAGPARGRPAGVELTRAGFLRSGRARGSNNPARAGCPRRGRALRRPVRRRRGWRCGAPRRPRGSRRGRRRPPASGRSRGGAARPAPR